MLAMPAWLFCMAQRSEMETEAWEMPADRAPPGRFSDRIGDTDRIKQNVSMSVFMYIIA
jgi:hypothetical protein